MGRAGRCGKMCSQVTTRRVTWHGEYASQRLVAGLTNLVHSDLPREIKLRAAGGAEVGGWVGVGAAAGDVSRHVVDKIVDSCLQPVRGCALVAGWLRTAGLAAACGCSLAIRFGNSDEHRTLCSRHSVTTFGHG